ncbi:MAG: magnesium/cobalt transporter CorA [Clostridia bacterium]|nr:magnesium/cobalt transporter CorA [Clostridia bacterium]
MQSKLRLPGSLEYTGKFRTEPITIEVYDYDEKSWTFHTYQKIEDIPLTRENTWINITGLHDMSILEAIEKKYHVDRFTLEDIVQVSTNCKIEENEKFSFSIFKMLYLKDQEIIHEHVSMIKTQQVLITFQETAGDVFDDLRKAIEEKIGKIRSSNIDFLYYRLIDHLVDQYFEILPSINKKIEDLEYDILEEKSMTLESIYSLKKELLLIRNAVLPVKMMLQNYLHSQHPLYRNYKDILDHLDQIMEHVNLYREIIGSLYDTQMSNLSYQTNKVMTTLAIFSTIFIPLSFLAGFFGMNFTYFPGLHQPYAIYIFIFICFLLGGGMFYFFKKRNFL